MCEVNGGGSSLWGSSFLSGPRDQVVWRKQLGSFADRPLTNFYLSPGSAWRKPGRMFQVVYQQRG